jgi:hypothetical protein
VRWSPLVRLSGRPHKLCLRLQWGRRVRGWGGRAGDGGAGAGGARARKALMLTTLLRGTVLQLREGLGREEGAAAHDAGEEGDVVVVAHQRIVARAPGVISASASAGCCVMCS